MRAQQDKFQPRAMSKYGNDELGQGKKSKLKNKQFIKIENIEMAIQQPKRSKINAKKQKQMKDQKVVQVEDDKDGEQKLKKKLNRHINLMQVADKKPEKGVDGEAVPKDKDTIVTIDNESAQICKILAYYLGQYRNENDKIMKDSQNIKICQDWQIEQIIKQVSDTNLGDYIIKFPNPDNIPDDLKQIYGDIDTQDQREKKKNFFHIHQAMEFYYQILDCESQSKLLSQREQIAFVLGFYFLKFKNNNENQDEYVSMHFIKLYNFFKKVENVKIRDYVLLRSQPKFEQNYEREVKTLYFKEFNKIPILRNEQQESMFDMQASENRSARDDVASIDRLSIYSNSDQVGKKQAHPKKKEKIKNTDETSWSKLKKKIHSDLNEYLLTQFKAYWKIQRQEEEHNDLLQKKRKKGEQLKDLRNTNLDHPFHRLVSKIKNLSELIMTFPIFLKQLLIKIKEEPEKFLKNKKRIMFGGQYLKKTIEGQNTKWVNTKIRPNDMGTLIRFACIYELVIKSHLFVRSFLSKDQQYIMLIIKIRDQILENYAQKYKIQLEVELGATDLFSLQPVDNYLRPLRLHNYVRDTQFIEKYNIKPKDNSKKKPTNKQEQAKDLISIESQAAIIYEKVQKMNQDQLRTTIIQDQFEADKLYEFLAKKLNIGFISQKILVNKYNSKDPSRKTWQLFYIYNRFVIEYINRVKDLYAPDKKFVDYHRQLEANVGMILRLMFLKALYVCNDLFYNKREVNSSIPRIVGNFFETKFKLKTIWTHLGIKSPSGFHTYVRKEVNEKMWRKFEINQLKDRSKFFPAERLMITNHVVNKHINISKAYQKKHVIQFYPLHDPYVLKNIEIMPYIMNIRSKGKKNKEKQAQALDGKVINKLYSQYECPYTQNDFSKQCLQDKLELKFDKIVTNFSTQSIRYYCGEKIAFYFEFIKYLALKASHPVYLIFIIIAQALLWKQQQDILQVGQSQLTQFNNFLVVILTFFNVFWITNLVETWKNQEKKISQNYGVTQLAEFQEKRVKFVGSFKRNFETDQLNFEYVPKWKIGLKTLFTFFLNLVYLALVILVILLLFLFKTYLFQSGVQQTWVNLIPSVLISIASQIFTKVYKFLIHQITIFENHKTVSDYQASLISKSSLISFIITFFSIFIFAFFSGYINSDYLCAIKTTTTLQTIVNCDYFLSSQLLSMVLVDFAVTIVGALVPLIKYKINQFRAAKQTKKKTKFNYNFFQSIDNFYEEQDSMESYMFNEQLDNSWQGYMNIINVFIATALFAPALPFTYIMTFVTSSVRLHASKFEVIYYKRRILPIKTNSINWWLFIIEIVSFVSILTNVAYMIYTRKIFSKNQARIFFLFIVIFVAIKYYLLTQYDKDKNIMAKRNDIKVTDFLLKRGNDKHQCIPEEINTDIQNVIYDEKKLNRKFHQIKAPQIKKVN